jgi:hypothetical protein
MSHLDIEEQLVRQELRRKRTVKKRPQVTLATQRRAMMTSREYQGSKKKVIVVIDKLKKKS